MQHILHPCLCDVPIGPPHQANAILRLDKTKRELAEILDALLGSPVRSTLLHAIHCGHLSTFPYIVLPTDYLKQIAANMLSII